MRCRGAVFVDLGEHRLRDLASPERVFQVVASGAAIASSRRWCRWMRSRRIFPVQPTSFVGRDDELGVDRGRPERSRLVTLTGVGGVGKTRLAVQVAARGAAASIADGVVVL